jgi:hypothetical protein
MKNKLSDLNDHLFAQLERLSDEELEGEALDREINRTKAITSVSQQVIMNANLVLNAHKAAADGLIQRPQAEKLIGG